MFILTSILSLITFINFLEIKKTTAGKLPSLWTIPLLTILILIMPFVAILVGIFAVYRKVIGILLKIKHGEKFIDFLCGMDAYQTIGEPKQHINHCLVIYRFPKGTPFNTYHQGIEMVARGLQSIPRCKVIFKKAFGYSYMLQATLNVGDHLKQMKIIDQTERQKLSKMELVSLLNEYINMDLPKDISWELIMGTQKIDWRDDEYDYYPTLFKFHHVLMDGISAVRSVIYSHSFDNNNKSEVLEASTLEKSRNLKDLLKLITVKNFVALLLIPSWYVSSFVLRGKDENLLRGPKLSNYYYNAMNTEESPGYIQKIKRIKNNFSGVSFTDVVLVAISGSLNDYFRKKSCDVDKITIITPVMMDATKLLTTTKVALKELSDIGNNFSIFIQDFPISVENTTNQSGLIKRLLLINKHTKPLKTSFQYLTSRLVGMALYGYIPQQLLGFMQGSMKCTAIISFLPGMPEIVCLNGLGTVSDIAPMNSHAEDTGLTIIIHTYDGRLQVFVSIDKALVGDYSDAQEIADNILKNLDLLEKEVFEYKLK